MTQNVLNFLARSLVFAIGLGDVSAISEEGASTSFMSVDRPQLVGRLPALHCLQPLLSSWARLGGRSTTCVSVEVELERKHTADREGSWAWHQET